MRPDLFALMFLCAILGTKFSVVVSTKLVKEPISGAGIVDDLASPASKYFFKPKPSTAARSVSSPTENVSTSNSTSTEKASARVLKRWEDTRKALDSQTDGRCLRIHVAFRQGYNKSSNGSTLKLLRELGELDEGSMMLSAVRVKGNEVRVIIDASNYEALFLDPKLREGIANLLSQHGNP